jgi:hypothetical protein
MRIGLALVRADYRAGTSPLKPSTSLFRFKISRSAPRQTLADDLRNIQ